MKTAAILAFQGRIKSAATVIVLAGCLILSSCGGGGGGGGDGFRGAGDVNLSVEPSSIDVGDRMLVTAEISNINEDGIIVKFEYPEQLSYVLNTAYLEVDGDEVDIGPSANVTVDGVTYLVFFLSIDELGDNNFGRLYVQLRGDSEVSKESVRIDLDVDDPLIDNPGEFDPNDPEFQAVDEQGIEVNT